MRLLLLAAFLAACGPAEREVSEPEETAGTDEPAAITGPRIRLRSVDLHAATRFVAEATRSNLAAIGDADIRSVDLPLQSGAVQALAEAYGARVQRHGALQLIAPAELAARTTEVPGHRPAEAVPIDLAFELAEVSNVMTLLADVTQQAVQSDDLSQGRITLVARHVPAHDVFWALIEICGGSGDRGDDGSLALLPGMLCRESRNPRPPCPDPTSPGPADPAAAGLERALHCAAVDQLRVLAIADTPTPRALVAGRLLGEPIVLRQGDTFETREQPWTVVTVTESSVVLDGGPTLELPPL